MSATSLSTNTDSIIGESNDIFAGLSLEESMTKYLSPDQVFLSKEALSLFLTKLAFKYTFAVSLNGQKFVCKQGHKRSKKDSQSKPDSPQGPKANRSTPVSYKLDCKWHVSFTGTVRKANGPGKKNQYDLTRPVKVTSCECKHNHTCDKQNLVAVIQRSGDLYQNLSSHAMFYLCNLLEHSSRVDGNLIRSVLSNCYPAAFKWSAMQISNLRTFVLSKLSKMAPETKKDYAAFVAKFPNKTFLDGINLSSLDPLDGTIIKNIWKDSMNAKSESGNTMILEMLQSMKRMIPGFDFRCSFDADGILTAFVWQTAVMRLNLLMYGRNACLDFMHSETNDLLWPYTAFALRRETNRLCLGNARIRECKKARRREAFQYLHSCILTIVLLTSFLTRSGRRREVQE